MITLTKEVRSQGEHKLDWRALLRNHWRGWKAGAAVGALVVLRRTQSQFPAHTGHLTTISNLSAKGSSPLQTHSAHAGKRKTEINI